MFFYFKEKIKIFFIALLKEIESLNNLIISSAFSFIFICNLFSLRSSFFSLLSFSISFLISCSRFLIFSLSSFTSTSIFFISCSLFFISYFFSLILFWFICICFSQLEISVSKVVCSFSFSLINLLKFSHNSFQFFWILSWIGLVSVKSIGWVTLLQIQ